MKLDAVVDITVRPMQQFFSQMPMLRTEILRWQKMKQAVIIMVHDENAWQRLLKPLMILKLPLPKQIRTIYCQMKFN